MTDKATGTESLEVVNSGAEDWIAEEGGGVSDREAAIRDSFPRYDKLLAELAAARAANDEALDAYEKQLRINAELVQLNAQHIERERGLREALRAMLELDSYRPRDGSVNEDWERGILALAFSLMGKHPFHDRMLHERLRDPLFRAEYEKARAALDAAGGQRL